MGTTAKPIFTSTTRESINQPVLFGPQLGEVWGVGQTVRPEDPEPWTIIHEDGSIEYGRYETLSQAERHVEDEWEVERFSPRPQFRAPANPILVAFRRDYWAHESEGRALTAADYLWEVEHPDQYPDIIIDTLPVHVEHARKVLTRLAALR